jgi:hypothetical protein
MAKVACYLRQPITCDVSCKHGRHMSTKAVRTWPGGQGSCGHPPLLMVLPAHVDVVSRSILGGLHHDERLENKAA